MFSTVNAPDSFCEHAKNLAVIFDADLNFKNHLTVEVYRKLDPYYHNQILKSF